MTDLVNNSNDASDPFDPASLRLDQSFADTAGVKKLLTTVPVGKPGRQEFGRVHRDLAFRLTPAAIIEVKEDREVYLVLPGIAQQLPPGGLLIRPVPTRCSSPITLAPKSVAISLSAGRCPSACWIYLPSSGITPMAFRQ